MNARLLALAYHPDFKHNGLFYTYASSQLWQCRLQYDANNTPTGQAANCQNVLLEWRVQDPEPKRLTVDLASARELLRIDKPKSNHMVGR